LTGTAATVGLFGPCAVGGGLVDALAAGEGLAGEIPIVEPGTCSPPAASGEVFIAPGFWGSENPPPSQPPPPQPPPSQPPPTGSSPVPVAPGTQIVRHPTKQVRTRGRSVRIVFRFASDQPGATFLCKVDGGAFAACGALLVRRFTVGSHLVRVKARSTAGLVDPTPAVFRFRVKRIA
jgi:hypothetical protein